jgi:AraC-like DNA-binding protein
MSERLFLRLPEDELHAPESGVPANTMTEFAVPAALRPWVAQVTAYEEQFEEGREVVERVLPDGASRLIIGLGPEAVSVQIAGANASPVLLTMRGHVHGLSVALRPGAAAGLFGIAADELAGRLVSWDAIVDKTHRGLPERLAAAQDDAARVRTVLRTLHAMGRAPDPAPLRLLRHAQSRLREGAGDGLSVRALAAEMQLSERRLQQVFAAQLGLSPSVWRRLQRLQGMLRLLRAGEAGSPWAELALRAGYYDQSHLIHEFRALCGLTPEQFVRSVVSHSSNTPAEAAG